MAASAVTRPDKGWSWMVLFASFMVMVVCGSLGQSIGIVYVALLERYGQTSMKTSLVGSLFSSMLSIGGLFASFLLRRFSCRTVTMCGGLIAVVGMLICPFVTSLDLVIFIYGGIIGAALGCDYVTAIVVLSYNFQNKRNLANGISSSGNGFGVLVLAPIYQLSRDIFGNSGFFFIKAAVTLHVCVFGALYFPSYLELQTSKIGQRKKELSHSQKSDYKLLKLVLLNKALLMLCLSYFFASSCFYIIFAHFPYFVVHTGSSAMQASILLSVIGGVGLISRILIGFMTEDANIDVGVLLTGTFAIVGIATLLLPLYGSTLAGQTAYAVIFGIHNGNCFAIMIPLNGRLVSLDEMSLTSGLELFFAGVAIFIAPPIIGIVLDNGGSYDQCFIIAGSLALLASICVLCSEYLRLKLSIQGFSSQKVEDQVIEIEMRSNVKIDEWGVENEAEFRLLQKEAVSNDTSENVSNK